MKPLSTSDMISRATESANIELLRQTGKDMLEYFREVTGEDPMEYILDIMDNQESEPNTL